MACYEWNDINVTLKIKYDAYRLHLTLKYFLPESVVNLNLDNKGVYNFWLSPEHSGTKLNML